MGRKSKVMQKIIYCQGKWACEYICTLKDGKIKYIPLEGYDPGQKGKQFTAPEWLFTKDKLFPVQDLQSYNLSVIL